MTQNNVTVPALPAATNGLQLITTVDSCQTSAPTNLTCSGLGTITINFTDSAGNPVNVRNPVLHFSRFGGNATGSGQAIYFTATYTLTTAGVTLGAPATGAQNLSSSANTVRAATVSTAFNGACSTTAGANTAGCGSVPVIGTTSQLAFNVGAVRNSTASTANWNLLSGGHADAVFITVSFDEDFGDAPATYDPTAAASNLLSDLALGSGITADNTTVFNGGATGTPLVTPSPLASATATGDTDDAFTSLPVLTPATYRLSVPISGASASGQVCGWADFDKSGTFNTTTEQACGTFAAGATSVPLTFTIPSGASLAANDKLNVRLRAAYGTALTPTGLTYSGETEDYQVLVGSDVTVDKAAPVAVGSNGTLTYTIRVWNNGPGTTSAATVADTLPTGFNATGVTCTPTGTATCGSQSASGTTFSATTGNLNLDTTPTNSAPDGNFLTYVVTGTAPANGLLSNTVTVTAATGVTDPVSNNTSAAVTTRVIDAVNDTAVILPATGGNVSVLGNDTVGGAAATTSNSTVSISNNGGLTGLSVSNGQLVVPAGTAAGTYNVTYSLCDSTVTTACDTATVAITVLPAPTITKSYSLTSIPADSTTTSTLTLTLGNTGSTAQTLTSALNDNIGANLTITSVSGGTCAAASTSFSGTTVTYASGATIPAGGCTILVTVKSGTSGSYPNTIAAGALVTNAGSNAAATSATLTVTPAADLSISKTGPSTATSGTQITYVLTLSNAGPNAANGATFSDNVNNTFTGVTASCLNPTGGVSGCVATVGSGNNVTGSVGTFPSGGSVQIQITGTIPAGATANLTNTATITVPSGVTEINTGNNTSQTVTTTLTKSAALSVTKTDGQTNVIKGQSLTYTIVVSNGGPSSTQLTFNDNTFSGVTLSNWQCTAVTGSAACSNFLTAFPASGGAYNSLLTLQPNSSITLQVTGTVTATSGSISNTATITPATGVTDTTGTADNTATDTDTVIAAPQAQNDTGSTAVITPVTVNVLSNDTGTNLAASSVIFPAAGQPSGSTISNGGKTLVVAGQGQYDVQADGSIKFTPAAGFVGTASPVTYQVADAYGQTTTATLTITVSGTPALSIAKAVDTAYLRVTDDPNSQGTAALPASALSASTLTYTITVQNTGSVAATGVLLTDTLPAGLSFVSATNATSVVGGTYGTPATIVNTGSGQNLSFNVGTLNATEPAKSAQIVIKASVVLNANTNQSALLNTASASATGVSAVTSNQVRTDIIYPKLTKTVQNITKGTPASTALGGGLPSEKLEYCLNYFNYGSVALPAYTLTDQVPATTSALLGAYDSVVGGTVTGYGLKLTQGGTTTYLTSSADADGGQLTSSGGGFGSGTLTLKLGNLPAGASGSACFQVTIR